MLAPSTAAQWVGAIATSIAVVIALFKDEWLRYRRQPRLSLRIEPKQPDCQFIPITVRGPLGQLLWHGDSYWIRLWIKNEGRGRAEQVQVFVSRLYKEDANHEFAPVQNFIPMNLRWSHSRDQNNPEIFAPGVSQNFGKHCDLCSISDPANPTDALAGYTVGVARVVALRLRATRRPTANAVVRQPQIGAAGFLRMLGCVSTVLRTSSRMRHIPNCSATWSRR
jgi:hypothetical protein